MDCDIEQITDMVKSYLCKEGEIAKSLLLLDIEHRQCIGEAFEDNESILYNAEVIVS